MPSPPTSLLSVKPVRTITKDHPSGPSFTHHAHSIILSAASVFFNTGFVYPALNTKRTIHLLLIPTVIFTEILTFIYTGVFFMHESFDPLEVLDAALFLDILVNTVLTNLLPPLTSETTSPVVALQLPAAFLPSSPPPSIKYCLNHFQNVVSHPYFLLLDETQLQHLLSSRGLRISTESFLIPPFTIDGFSTTHPTASITYFVASGRTKSHMQWTGVNWL